MEGDLAVLWSLLLLPLRQRIWYAFCPSDALKCNLQTAISLTKFQYETILQASGILCKKGFYVFSNSQLDYLQQVLWGRLDIHINRSKLERNGKPLFFIAPVDKPHQNPSAQANVNPTYNQIAKAIMDLMPNNPIA